jgi:hypothetical protein
VGPVDRWRRWHKRTLGWTANSIHTFEASFRRSWWPLFYSTHFSPPRFKIRLRNQEEPLERTSVEIEAAPYDDDLAQVSGLQEGWRSSSNHPTGTWKSGELKKVRVRLQHACLPRPGSYVMRVRIVNWIKQDEAEASRFNELMRRALEREISKKELQEQLRDFGPGLSGPAVIAAGTGEVRRGVTLWEGVLLRYLAVEEPGTVLTFWLVAATFLTALATIVVALTTS